MSSVRNLVIFMTATRRNSGCGAGCHDDQTWTCRTKRASWPASIQYGTCKSVGGGGNSMLLDTAKCSTLNTNLDYLKRQYIKTRTHASKGSACTDGLWFAFIFSLCLGGKMVSNRCFFFNQTSLHQSPSTLLRFVGYVENLSGDELIITYNYQTNSLMTDAVLIVSGT